MSQHRHLASRAVFGAAAVAMTALTLAVAVVLPATLAAASEAARPVTLGEAAAPVGTHPGTDRMRIEVVGTRVREVGFERVGQGAAARARQG